MCALSVVSITCGICSPHLALDIWLVKALQSNCACESLLMRPYLMFIAALRCYALSTKIGLHKILTLELLYKSPRAARATLYQRKDSLLLAVLVVRLVGLQRVQQGTNVLKEGFAALQLFLDIGVVKLGKSDIVALLAVPKEAVIQFAMMFGESARLDDFPVEGCTHTAVLRELVPLFQEEGAHRIEQGIVGAVHRERVIPRCQLTARGA